MVDEEIIENNRLIAVFMGGEIIVNYPDHDLIDYIRKENYPTLTRYHATTTLLYHLSWDWLMPVVERIESLGYSTRILDTGMGVEGDLIIERFGKTKLEGTYLTIIEVIKWYNSNKQ